MILFSQPVHACLQTGIFFRPYTIHRHVMNRIGDLTLEDRRHFSSQSTLYRTLVPRAYCRVSFDLFPGMADLFKGETTLNIRLMRCMYRATCMSCMRFMGFFFFFLWMLYWESVASDLPSPPPFSPIYLCFVCICGLGRGKDKQPHGG